MKNINLPQTLAQEWDKFKAQQETTQGTAKQIFKLSCGVHKARRALANFYAMRVAMSGHLLNVSDELKHDLDCVAKWATSTELKHSLIIRGDNGNGKTTLANALCDLMESSGELLVMRIESHTFSDMFAIGVTEDAKQKNNDLMSQMMKTKILFIDKMGKDEPEYRNWGTVHRPLERILVYRYERGKQTILTTNLGDDEIQARYGNHVLDRIKERYNRLVITRPSYR